MDRRGFTLIELLVVLTIMALFVSLAAPAMTGAVPGFELKAAVSDLGTALRRSRSEALRTNRSTFVEVDVRKPGYRVGDDGGVVAFPPGTQITLTIAKRERSGQGRGRIRFFPDGTATGARLVIAGAGKIIEMEVDWFDGRIVRRTSAL